MNPYAILGGIILWGASIGGAFFYGQGVGKDSQIAKESAVKDAISETRAAAQLGAADAIAKIKVRNTTIQGRVETIVRDNPVYRDPACAHSPDGLRNLNEALGGGTGPASSGIVPAAVAAK